jgi:hypothetical protein
MWANSLPNDQGAGLLRYASGALSRQCQVKERKQATVLRGEVCSPAQRGGAQWKYRSPAKS